MEEQAEGGKKKRKPLKEVGAEGAGEENKKEKRPRRVKEAANPNLLKTNNKLIGFVDNKDLYGEDDDEVNNGVI